jgi:hypothetical protein
LAAAFRRAKEQVRHDLARLVDIHHLSDSRSPVDNREMAKKPSGPRKSHAHEDDDGYRLPEGRRHEMLSLMQLHALGKDPFVLMRDASDGVVEVTYHKVRGALAAIPEAERNESNAWLTARGMEPMRVPLSPQVARDVGLVSNQGIPDWVDGPPTHEPPGWKNTRRYLPAELPNGWKIFASRGDGGLMVETEDESVLVLSCEKRSGMKTLLLTVGHQRDLPVDADALFKRLRGIGQVRETGRMGPQRIFVARIYGAS